MSAKQFFLVVCDTISEALRPHGFKGPRGKYWATRGEIVLTVQLQRSVSSTSDYLRITANLCIFSIPLGRACGLETMRPPIVACSYQQRLDQFPPCNRPYWWEMHSDEEAQQSAADMCKVLVEHVLPKMEWMAMAPEVINLGSIHPDNATAGIIWYAYQRMIREC